MCSHAFCWQTANIVLLVLSFESYVLPKACSLPLIIFSPTSSLMKRGIISLFFTVETVILVKTSNIFHFLPLKRFNNKIHLSFITLHRKPLYIWISFLCIVRILPVIFRELINQKPCDYSGFTFFPFPSRLRFFQQMTPVAEVLSPF